MHLIAVGNNSKFINNYLINILRSQYKDDQSVVVNVSCSYNELISIKCMVPGNFRSIGIIYLYNDCLHMIGDNNHVDQISLSDLNMYDHICKFINEIIMSNVSSVIRSMTGICYD